MAARLNHPNIVQTNDVDESHGRHFIAMEYLEGRSLYHVLKRFARARRLSAARWRSRVLRDVLAALDYAHELRDFDGKPLGFVHRDVSPHNVFLTYDGHAKVIDFGIAKARDSSLETKTGVLKGQRRLHGARAARPASADRRSDIFSVGAVLFGGADRPPLVAGHERHGGPGGADARRDSVAAAVRPDTAADPRRDLPARAGARGPRIAFATAAEMRDALDQYLWATGGAPRHRDMSTCSRRSSTASGSACARSSKARSSACRRARAGRLEALDFRDPRDSAHDSRRGSGGSGGGDRSLHTASSISAVRHTPSVVGYAPPPCAHAVGAARPAGRHRHRCARGRRRCRRRTGAARAARVAALGSRIWRGQPWPVVGPRSSVVFVATTRRPWPAPSAPAPTGAAGAAPPPVPAARSAPRQPRRRRRWSCSRCRWRRRRRASPRRPADAVEPVHRPLPQGDAARTASARARPDIMPRSGS